MIATPGRPRIALAALDMAGTTVADDGAVTAAFREALEVVGPPGPVLGDDDRPEVAEARRDPEGYVRRTMGRSKIEVFTVLTGGDRARAGEANLAFEAAFARGIDRGEVAPVPGATDAMARLRAGGIRVCLTTGFSPATRDRILAALGWDGLVDLVLSPADAGRGRPYPDMILTAVLRLGIDDVAQVAVAGDTTSDLVAGTRAGASVVAGVLTGAHTRAELEEAPHTHLLASIADLPDVVLA